MVSKLKKLIDEISAKRKNPPTLKTASFSVDIESYNKISEFMQNQEVSFSALVNEYLKSLVKEIDEIENEKNKKSKEKETDDKKEVVVVEKINNTK